MIHFFSVTGGFGANRASAARQACARRSRSFGVRAADVLAAVYAPEWWAIFDHMFG
jgi:hypothetical protein